MLSQLISHVAQGGRGSQADREVLIAQSATIDPLTHFKLAIQLLSQRLPILYTGLTVSTNDIKVPRRLCSSICFSMLVKVLYSVLHIAAQCSSIQQVDGAYCEKMAHLI